MTPTHDGIITESRKQEIKNGQDEEDKLEGNFVCLLALPEKLDTLFKNENEWQLKLAWFQC